MKQRGAVQTVGNPLAGTGIFNDNKYKSTQVVFRGQDKDNRQYLGTSLKDPDQKVGPMDEIIENYQQQLHFMELELKILKEKVINDEKDSGMGSLFDDEKTSHQHIQLLKVKYQEMRRKYDKLQDDLNKQKLDVIGEQLILESQIDTLKNQKDEITAKANDQNRKQEKIKFDLEKRLKDLTKQKNMIEQELSEFTLQFEREAKQNYESKMKIDIKANMDQLVLERHEQDVTLLKDMLKLKQDQLNRIVTGRAQA